MFKTCSFIITFLFFLGSCSLFATRPKLEMHLAQSAFEAAQNVEAFQYHPAIYNKAELFFLKAKAAYQKKDFDKARKFALISKRYSEEAELRTVRTTVVEGSR